MANTASAAVAGSLLIFKTTTSTTKTTSSFPLSSYPSTKNRTILSSLSSPCPSSSLVHNPHAAILFSSSSSSINNSDILPIANKFRNFRVLASEVTSTATTTDEEVGDQSASADATSTLSQLAQVEGTIVQRPPFELYVCNLPRSVGDSELTEMFKPYGPIESIEVARNPETGISKGWSYVVMSSLAEAKAAIMALDGSDVDGREVRVKFSNAMVVKRVLEAAKKKKKKNASTVMIFETPHKIYVGNLAWSVKPEELKIHFGEFGTVVSTRVLYDRKAGKNRVYGFLSFSTASELEAAIAGANGTEFQGRKMTVRQVIKPSTSTDSSDSSDSSEP
ncbi:hypothetical protein C5167_027571 [Papaver somniferum]|uniref:RNA-binding protein CP29B, chloroplastic-like n=1 Tax=Papaver somniferum TaxID=3469 RepID=UPI000E6FC002|nr:RNA-binding protein CP29B, chloroplastic-like [Papaver somniferum]RZC91510.1 hypothetical protein C5167_027571 [Papaver somniferum]